MNINVTPTPVPAVGDTILAKTVLNTYPANAYDGKTATVTSIHDAYVLAEFQSVQKPDDTTLLRVLHENYVLADGHTLTVSDPAPAEFSLGRDGVIVPADAGVQQLRDIIERLSNDLADEKQRCEHVNTSLNTRNQQFSDSINIIGTALMEEAERRGWCAEYDDFVESVNSQLPIYELPIRQREFEVTWTQTVTVRIDRSATYTCASAEEAEDMAREEDLDESLIIDEVRNGNWDTDDYGYTDYEVEEV